MDQENFREIIEFAVEREEEAVKFYEDLQKIVKDKAALETLKDLAAMERNHIAILKKFKPEDSEMFREETVQDLKLSDYMVASVPMAATTFQDILVIAMKREEAARNLYTKIASKTQNKAMQDMFQMLAAQEAKHKLQLEQFYEDNISVEM